MKAIVRQFKEIKEDGFRELRPDFYPMVLFHVGTHPGLFFRKADAAYFFAGGEKIFLDRLIIRLRIIVCRPFMMEKFSVHHGFLFLTYGQPALGDGPVAE